MITVVILGDGNVGTHLCKAIHASEGIKLVQWYNRSKINNNDSKRKDKIGEKR